MSQTTLDRSRAPEPGPVKPFHFPDVRRGRIEGGQSPQLLTARHGDLPLITAAVVVEGGAGGEPPEAAGVAQLTAEALETGTASRDVEQLAWELESLGVELEASAGWDTASVSITVPAERLEPAMALLAEVVRRPAFPTDQVERIRDERLADILQRRKEPRALASDAAARFIYRQGAPYGRPLIGLEETVRQIRPDQLRQFHDQRYRGGSSAVIMTGAVDHERARRVTVEHFGDWHGTAPGDTELDVAPRAEVATVHIVHRPGSVQSEIRMGHVGVDRHHVDYFPLTVFNTILGGAFTSRLNMSLRERHGFTYGARSGFAFRRAAGPFSIDAAVASDVTARAIEEALRELRQLREDGPTEQELDSARDYLRGVLPLRLQTTSDLASRIAQLVVYDLPDDYFARYRDRIAEVTGDDVRRVGQDVVQPDRLAIIVVGDAEQIEAPLRELGIGAVQVHDTLP